MLPSLVALLSTISVAAAASCGGSGIPFRFEVLPSGTPVLGCASPQCFGGDGGGRDVLHDSKFNAGPDGEDGFFRENDLSRARSRYMDAPGQQAECPASFESTSCVNPLTWVGGFLAQPDGSLRLQCCHYGGLRFGAEVGRPVVHAGEVYSGGEVLRDGRQTGFDLISNVRRTEAQDGTIAYELTVTRMNCLPDPPEGINDVSLDSSNDISRILDKVGEIQQSPPSQQQLDPAPLDNSIQQQPVQPGSDTYVQTPQDAPADPPTQEQYVQVGEQVIPVTSAGYYYPVASGVPACFTGDTVIQTPSGPKMMEDLRIGDIVLTTESNAPTFVPVLSFLHRLPEVNASFIRLATPTSALKLTPQHFIYKVDCHDASSTQLVYAEDLHQGDCLLEEYPEGEDFLRISPIVSVSIVRQQGVYAPMTSSGDLFVNGIWASCHNVVRHSTLTHTFLHAATQLQEKMRSFFGASSESSGHLPSTAEFFLNAIEHIIPVKI